MKISKLNLLVQNVETFYIIPILITIIHFMFMVPCIADLY